MKKRLEKYSSSERQKNRMIEVDNSECCCGNCDMYSGEDMSGSGWCDIHEDPRDCDEYCDDWCDGYFMMN